MKVKGFNILFASCTRGHLTRELVVQDIEGALADVDPVRYSP